VWGAVAALQTGLLYAFAQGYVDRYFTDGRVTVYSVLVALVSLVVIFRNNARQEGLAARAERGWQPVRRGAGARVGRGWRPCGEGLAARAERGWQPVRRGAGSPCGGGCQPVWTGVLQGKDGKCSGGGGAQRRCGASAGHHAELLGGWADTEQVLAVPFSFSPSPQLWPLSRGSHPAASDVVGVDGCLREGTPALLHASPTAAAAASAVCRVFRHACQRPLPVVHHSSS
jgi:hypothetical protein